MLYFSSVAFFPTSLTFSFLHIDSFKFVTPSYLLNTKEVKRSFRDTPKITERGGGRERESCEQATEIHKELQQYSVALVVS